MAFHSHRSPSGSFCSPLRRRRRQSNTSCRLRVHNFGSLCNTTKLPISWNVSSHLEPIHPHPPPTDKRAARECVGGGQGREWERFLPGEERMREGFSWKTPNARVFVVTHKFYIHPRHRHHHRRRRRRRRRGNQRGHRVIIDQLLHRDQTGLQRICGQAKFSGNCHGIVSLLFINQTSIRGQILMVIIGEIVR